MDRCFQYFLSLNVTIHLSTTAVLLYFPNGVVDASVNAE